MVTIQLGATVPQIRASLSPAIQALVKGYPSLLNIPVQWGEQDVC